MGVAKSDCKAPQSQWSVHRVGGADPHTIFGNREAGRIMESVSYDLRIQEARSERLPEHEANVQLRSLVSCDECLRKSAEQPWNTAFVIMFFNWALISRALTGATRCSENRTAPTRGGRLPSTYYARTTFHVSTIQKSSESPIGS